MIEITLPKRPNPDYRTSTKRKRHCFWDTKSMEAYGVNSVKKAILLLYKEGLLKEQVIITADTRSALYPYLEEDLDRVDSSQIPA
jgi:hypothetical protein